MSEDREDIAPIGAQIPDDPTDPDPSTLDDVSDEAIEAELQARLNPAPPDDRAEDEAAPAPQPHVANTDQPSGNEPAQSASAQVPAETPEPEAELDDIRGQVAAAKEAKLLAELELSRAHASRLAARLGNIEQKMKSAAPPEPEGKDWQDAEPRDSVVHELKSRLERMEQTSREEARDRAIVEELSSMGSRPDFAKLNSSESGRDAIKQACAKYVDDFAAAQTAEDPPTARLLARAISASILAEATAIHVAKLEDEVKKRSFDGQQKIRDRKRDSSPPAIGPSALSRRPVAKSLDDLSDEELERLTNEAVSRS